MRKDKRAKSIRKDHIGLYFVLPFFIGYTIFGLFPIVYTLILSFQKWDGFTEPVFVGLANYKRLLNDSLFFKSIGNTLIIWILSIVPQVTLALVLAMILNEKDVRGRHFFRAVYYFPNLVSAITLGVLFSLMFDWKNGSVNSMLMFLGIINEPINWFNSSMLSRMITALVVLWLNFGFNMLTFIAGLQSIPDELYEAAQIDGANRWQIMTKINFPLIRPVFLFTVITSVIGGLQLFDAPLMLGRGVKNSTLTMVMYMYETAFKNFDFSYGATIAYGIFFIVMVATLITLGLTRAKNTYRL